MCTFRKKEEAKLLKTRNMFTGAMYTRGCRKIVCAENGGWGNLTIHRIVYASSIPMNDISYESKYMSLYVTVHYELIF